YPVQRLVRTEFDRLKLGRLNPGEWRYLSSSEVELLQNSAETTRHQRKSIRPDDRKPGARTSPRRASGTSTFERGTRRSQRDQRHEDRNRPEREGYGERSRSDSRRERSDWTDREERPRRPRSDNRSGQYERSDRPQRARPAGSDERRERSDRPPRYRS